ncbi:MAG: rhodanese-like domain-containing protein [Methanophagales archaeon]|nr:rhodanese-like domain-containing protein [Methanophagales archaeon]
MKKELFALTVVVLLSAFAGAGMQTACASVPSASAHNGIKIISFSTDKDVYQEKEDMTIFLSVYSPEEISNVLIRALGVRSNKGVDYVNFVSETDLTVGENNMTFTKTLPSCSRCVGIDQGTYFINLSVAYDAKVVEATHSIAITSQPDQIIPVDIVVDEAKRLIDSESEDLIFLDVRTGEEYNAAHIEGARLIPLSELSNRTEELNKSTKIVVYSEDGSNSTTACEILIEKGFEQVYTVLGGITAWNESGYPLVPTTAPEQPGFEAALAIAAVLIGTYWIKRSKASFK